jgi:hypothetical protein
LPLFGGDGPLQPEGARNPGTFGRYCRRGAKKFSAKVPMNSAASARIKPIAVLVTVNYLEINGLTLTYIAGHWRPVNMSKSW